MANPLRAGNFSSNGDDTMTAYIEAAMQDQWQRARGEPLPAQGADDRRILFAAIAQGVLRYLYVHRDDLVSTLQQPEGIAGDHRHDAAFDLVEKP